MRQQISWYPLRDPVTSERDSYYPLYQAWTTKGLAKLFGGLACLGLWLLSGLAAHFGYPYPIWLQILLVAAGFGLVFWCVPDVPGDTSRNETARYEDRWRKVFASLAEAKDCSLRLIHPAVTTTLMKEKGASRPDPQEARDGIISEFKSARPDLEIPEPQIDAMLTQNFNTTHETAAYEVQDPAVYPLLHNYPDMVAPGIMVSRPFSIQAVFRWSQGHERHWTAIGVLEGDVRGFRGRISKEPDAATLFLIFAVPLARDTAVSARLFARLPVVSGRGATRLDGEIFNDIFNVEMVEGQEFKLYQALTPAAQTCFLDLFERYGVEAHIDRGMLIIRFIAGTTLAADEDPVAAAAKLDAILLEIVETLPKLKTYLE